MEKMISFEFIVVLHRFIFEISRMLLLGRSSPWRCSGRVSRLHDQLFGIYN